MLTNGHQSYVSKMATDEAQDALAFAYQYGYPLFSYGKFVMGSPEGAPNSIYHERALADASFAKVVRPNVDTLYSISFLDLSTDNLTITVPGFDGRYWLFSFYDMYGNNFANIGSLENDAPGEYHLKMSFENFGVHRNATTSIDFPTPYGVFIARLHVKDDPDDKARVHGYQDATKLYPVPRTTGVVAPPLNLGLFADVAAESTCEEEQIMKLTALLAPYNQPEVLQDRSWVGRLLEKAGIRDGKFTQPPGTSLQAAVASANHSITALRTTAGLIRGLDNGWRCPSPSICGDFKSFYAARHLIATRGYLQLVSDQAIYPAFYSTPGNPNFSIGPEQACLFTFSAKPTVRPTGFWSLTLYNDLHLLVDNKLNRYAVGDQSNLRYPDGSLLKDKDDGEFQILIQAKTPPEKWMDNWLPAPEKGDNLSVTLRLYCVTPEMSDGTYKYPKFSIIDAIS